MCVSLAPAKFSKTKICVGKTTKTGKLLHHLIYGNTVANGNDNPFVTRRRSFDYSDRGLGRSSGRSSYGGGRGSSATGTGNAMLIPIPAKPGTVSQANVVDTSSGPNILKDMAEAIRPVSFSIGTRGGMSDAIPKGVQIFDHDIYTIVLAENDPNLIAAVLPQVRADRRPNMNEEIFAAYAKWYGTQFPYCALCCFNVEDEAEGKPLLWSYEPLNENFLFIPALDAHDGHAPDLEAYVDVDHTILVFTDTMDDRNASEVYYTDNLSPELQALLPKYVIGEEFSGSMQQGDFVASVADVESGNLDLRRELPPGAEAVDRRR